MSSMYYERFKETVVGCECFKICNLQKLCAQNPYIDSAESSPG